MTTVTDYKHAREIRIPDYNGQVPEGKAFYAWNTREDGTGAVHKPGKKLKMIENYCLYPMFIDSNKNDEMEDTEEADE